MKKTGLYIDMPFCIARCAFCAFHVEGFRSRWATTFAVAVGQRLGHAGAMEFNVAAARRAVGGLHQGPQAVRIPISSYQSASQNARLAARQSKSGRMTSCFEAAFD